MYDPNRVRKIQVGAMGPNGAGGGGHGHSGPGYNAMDDVPGVGGFRAFVRRRLNGIKKFQLVAMFFVSFIVLSFQAGKCVEKYLDAFTGTGDKYVHVSKISFPVMTICPTYPYRLDKLKVRTTHSPGSLHCTIEKRLQEHGIETKTAMQFNGQWVDKEQPSLSVADLYDEVVLDLEDIFINVFVNAEGNVDGKNNFDVGPKDLICGEVHQGK